MLLSIALILLSGLVLGGLCKKIHFPALFGMIISGIVLGPHVLNLIDVSILDMSANLRRIALIIILIRAGLKLSIDDLKKVGRPALLMCFVPACFEITGMALLAPKILGISLLDALILGAVIAAVSPAVIVPKMIKLIDEKYGTNKGIPQMILSGASVDDVFVIVMFTTFTSLAKGEAISVKEIINIPLSVIFGILIGFGVGLLLDYIFKHIELRLTVKVVLLVIVSFFLVTLEDKLEGLIPFASLLAVMAMGTMIKKNSSELSAKLSVRLDRVWVVAEIFLFVLVGASVQINMLLQAGISVIILLALVLIVRMIGVFVCVLGTNLKKSERLFCMLAYTPKATVQAAIGGIPLSMGLACGNIVLVVSVLAIMITAPLGAFAIDMTYKRFLEKE